MWIEKIVGDLGDKKRYREYKARVKALPTGYRETAGALERYLLYFGPGDGTSLIAMLDDLATLLEQSAADERPIREIVGEDPVEFAETFLRNYPEGSWIGKERQRLAASIDTAIEKEREP
jgi:DNA-binding ferritin-like protein (Dps family)